MHDDFFRRRRNREIENFEVPRAIPFFGRKRLHQPPHFLSAKIAELKQSLSVLIGNRSSIRQRLLEQPFYIPLFRGKDVPYQIADRRKPAVAVWPRSHFQNTGGLLTEQVSPIGAFPVGVLKQIRNGEPNIHFPRFTFLKITGSAA